MKWYKIAIDMNISTSKLFGWFPKVKEVMNDLQNGKTSKTMGPILVSKLDSIPGGWFVMDGYHRAMEMMLAGAKFVPGVVNKHVPFLERPVNAYQSIVSNMVRLSDYAHED